MYSQEPSTLPLDLLRIASPAFAGKSRWELQESFDSLSKEEREQVSHAIDLCREAFASLAPLVQATNERFEHPERSRSPKEGEVSEIALDDIVVFTKRSKLVYDCDVSGMTTEQVIKSYSEQNLKSERIATIIDSDNEQRLAHQALVEHFQRAGIDQPPIYVLDALEPEEIKKLIAKSRLVISLGGDDHAKAVSQYIGDDQYLCIVNSDSKYSTGALTYFDRGSLSDLISNLSRGDFLIEDWPRIEVSISSSDADGEVCKRYPLALSELSLADEFSLYTFRGNAEIPHRDDPLQIKGSGLLITTGAGSGGWFSSSAKYIYPKGRHFNRTENSLELIVREPYGETGGEESLTDKIYFGDEIVIRSTSKHSPEVSGDSIWKERLPAGAVVTVKIADKPIRVISNQQIRSN